MDKIPSLIPTIVFIGNMNVGKSSIVNALINQNISIVSDIAGTTTDEVVKRFELLDVGPINIVDTAGLNDKSTLGYLRVEKTKKAIKQASLLIYVVDASNDLCLKEFNSIKDDKILLFNKIDLLSIEKLEKLKKEYPNAFFLSTIDLSYIDAFKVYLTNRLNEVEKILLSGIELSFNKIVHVIPIDSEAPKGRLILPQMQLIRECLDLDIISIVLKDSELKEYLNQNDDVGLIVTDSQAFKVVSIINDKRFPLTSYSILQANQKGDLKLFVDNLKYLEQLNTHPKILMMESCSHNTSHEDIGKVKIPKMLSKHLNRDIDFDFRMSNDFVDNLSDYDFIVHCGSCMLHSKVMQRRIKLANEANVPITNYGLLIAYYNGILSEAIKIFGIETEVKV